jgi:hypothetical protein
LVMHPLVGGCEPEGVVQGIGESGEHPRQERRIGWIDHSLPMLELWIPDQHA